MSFQFEQLPLAVQLRDNATFDNYYVGDNALLIDSLRQQLVDGERYIYLYGPAGSGKSHLLQASCHHAEKLGFESVYLPLNDLIDYPPEELFAGLEHLSLVCLDDIHCVVSHPHWQQHLFHLFNRLADQQVCLLISAESAVRELPIDLADLESRLSWGAIFQMIKLTDEQLQELMQLRANGRGLQLSDDVAQFIYHRCHRNTAQLLEVLDKLDKASLKQQRRLTVPFVKSIMGW